MLKKFQFPFILLLVLCLPASLYAAENPKNQDTSQLEDVWVQATSVTDDALGDSIIHQEVMERPSISDSIIESLQGQAGLQVLGTSLFGSKEAKVRLRGFNQTRFRVLVDGMPIQRDGSYGNGPVDWSMFSPDWVENIEIMRGAVPVEYGNTLGGVINIITKKPTKEPETRVQTVYGSLDTWKVNALHRWKVGPVGWALSASHYQTDGYLRNNYADRNNLSGQLSFDLPWQMEAGVGLFFSDGKTGLPVYNRPDSPYYDSGKPDADQKELGGPGISSRLLRGVYGWGNESETKDTNTLYTAYLKKNFKAGSLSVKGMLWNQKTTDTYYNSQGGSNKLYERDSTPEDNNWQLMADFDYTLGDHTLAVGGETRTYGWGEQTVSYIDRSQFNGSINFFKFVTDGFLGQEDCLQYNALYAQDTWQAMDNLEIELGLRGEWFEAKEIDPAAFGFPNNARAASLSESSVDPRLAIRFNPWKEGVIGLRVGIAHRFPNSPEYFWWYLNRGSGFFNTSLDPEKATQYELGIEQRFGNKAVLAARAYYYQVDNYLSSTSVPGTGTVVYNIDQVDIKGAEFEAGVKLPWHLHLWGNLTLQEAEKEGDPWDSASQSEAQLPNFPEVMANLGLDYRRPESFSAGLTLHFTGDRDYLKNKTLCELGSYVLLNAHATYRLADTEYGKWELVANAANILDQDYELEAGYPMPGFTVIGGVRFIF
jgi:outer membrane receptor protein involved in Fe transport